MGKELVQLLLDHMIEGVVVLGGGGQIVQISARAAALLGPPRSAEQRLTSAFPAVAEALTGRDEAVISLHGRTLRVRRIVPPPESGMAALLLVADETELAALREEVQINDAILESFYDPVYIIDGNGITLKTNSAIERFYQVSKRDLIGKHVSELGQGQVSFPSSTYAALKKGEQVSLLQDTKSGHRLLATATPVRNAAGQIIRVVSNLRDVTALEQLKRQLEELERRNRESQAELQHLRRSAVQVPGVVAESDAMKRVLALVRRVAGVDSTVLLTGESGVGKTALARTIHSLSPRAGGPFIDINCAAIPEALIESELFGYEAGAFTGAQRAGKPGLASLANHGTLFLDEVGELPLAVQAKLLTLVQERRFVPVGGRQPVSVDIRLLAATNRDLPRLVAEGKFREDLYYRLSVVSIRVPPLRERREDVVPLIQQFLAQHNRRYGLHKSLAPELLQRLSQHDWPGNVRELANLVEMLVVTSEHPVIGISDLPRHLAEEEAPAMRDGAWRKLGLRRALARVEREIILSAYAECGSTYEAARALGISQSTFARRLQRYVRGTAGKSKKT